MPSRKTPARPSKRETIREAATRLFLETGYGATSMDAIAHAAKVSKPTIYSHFGSKDALFGDIIEHLCREAVSPLADLSDLGARDPRAALTAYARQTMDLFLSPVTLAAFRIVIAELPRFPELSRVLYERGAVRIYGDLEAYLAAEAKRGRLRIDDPPLAAHQFLGLIKEHLFWPWLLNLRAPSSPEETRRVIEQATNMFLKTYEITPRPHARTATRTG